MYQKKLVVILSSFTHKELKACYSHLSTSLNKETDEFRLFMYIWNSKNNWNSKKLEIKRARDKIKPGLSLQKFQNLMSSLVGKIERFIIAYEGDSAQLKFENQLRLGAYYKQKGLYTYFTQVHRKIEKIAEELPQLDTEYQRLKMQQQHQLFFSKLKVDNQITLLRNTWEALERYYQQKKLVYEIEVANQQNLYNITISPPDTSIDMSFDTILQRQKEMVDNEEKIHFDFLENHLLNHYDEFSTETAYTLLNYLINAYSLKIKKGNISYIGKVAVLYDFGFTSNCLLYNGKLTVMTFLNIINVWSNTSKNMRQKVLAIIPRSAEYVNTTDNEVLQSIARAIYYFALEDYTNSRKYLNITGINQKDLAFSTRVNLIRLASLYADEPDLMNKENFINSTFRFLKKIKKKLSKENYLALVNTTKIIQMMWKQQPTATVLAFKENCKHLFLQIWMEKALKDYKH